MSVFPTIFSQFLRAKALIGMLRAAYNTGLGSLYENQLAIIPGTIVCIQLSEQLCRVESRGTYQRTHARKLRGNHGGSSLCNVDKASTHSRRAKPNSKSQLQDRSSRIRVEWE